jgi:archaellum component FlaD/FlaE
MIHYQVEVEVALSLVMPWLTFLIKLNGFMMSLISITYYLLNGLISELSLFVKTVERFN